MQTYLEYPIGSRTTKTQFDLGSTIKIQVTNGNAFFNVQMTIVYDNPNISPAFNTGTFSIMGNEFFDVTLPNLVTKGKIIITEEGYSIIPTLTNTINIGVGAPADVTKPPAVAGDIFTEIETVAKWVAIGAGVVAVAYLASKAAPSVIKAVSSSKKNGN
jgi:hypothetical protein